MKKNLLLTLTAIFGLLFIVSSCKKDDDPQDLLVDATCWKLSKTESRDNSTSAWVDDTEACSSDDCWNFTADGKVITDEGATKCAVDDPQSTTGSYTLTGEGTVLTLTEDGVSLPFTVVELTANKMVITLSLFGESRWTFVN